MKKNATAKLLLLLAATVLAASLLTGCGGVTLRESGADGCVDQKNDLTYQHASVCYEPVSLGERYGTLKVTSQESYELYTIPGLDPAQWLATEESHVLYTSDATLPALSDMKPTAVHICVDGSVIRQVGTIDDGEAVTSLVKAYSEGASIMYPATAPLRTYRIRFASVEYPSLYYTLTYIEYTSDLVLEEVNYGRYFLYNAFDQIFVPVGDEIHTALGLT